MTSAMLMQSGAAAALGAKAASMRPVRARASVVVNAAGILGDKWYPGATVPKHLAKADLAGNYGFDPLRLGTDPAQLAWYVEAEKTNARWAMAAVPGIVVTEALGLPSWVTAGAEVDLPLPLPTIIGIEIVIFSLLELKRYEGFVKTGKSGFLNSFPFDPLGYANDDTAEKELRNGRVAMLAFLGFASVYAVRGLGPIAALKMHLENPGQNNIFTSSVGDVVTLLVVALSVLPILVEARNALDPDEDEFDPIPW